MPVHIATTDLGVSVAPLASPALTGNPTAPTPAVGDNDTSIATTAFVNAEIANDAVPLARTVSTTAPLSGGGALSSNLTLGISEATTSATGVVELATEAEALTGTSTSLAVTPSGLKGALDARVASTLSAAALQFDGTAGAAISPATGAVGTGDFTFSAFVRKASSVGTLLGSATNGLEIGFNNDSGLRIRATDSAELLASNFPSSVGELFHIAVLRASGSWKIYKNGISVSTGTSAHDFTLGQDRLGSSQNTGISKIAGTIARASFLNFALTDAEILDLATNRLGVLPVEWQRGSMSNANSSTFAHYQEYETRGVFSSPSPTGFTFSDTSTVAGASQSSAGGIAQASIYTLRNSRFRVSFTITLNSGVIPSSVFVAFRINGAGWDSITGSKVVSISGAGTYTTEVTADTGLNRSTGILIGVAPGTYSVTISNVSVTPLGSLFTQPDANLGAGPVLRGNYGLPDLILPADGHTAGGVYRPAPNHYGDVYGSRTSTGFLIGDRELYPSDYFLSEILVKTSVNGATYSIGSSAGSPADVVSSRTSNSTNWIRILDPGVSSTRKLHITVSSGTIEVKAKFEKV